jgi:hypothetical protein
LFTLSGRLSDVHETVGHFTDRALMGDLLRMMKTSVLNRPRRVRRIFSPDEKRRMVEESKQPGQSVVRVARRYRLSTALLFRWRRQERLGLLTADGSTPEAETLAAR